MPNILFIESELPEDVQAGLRLKGHSTSNTAMIGGFGSITAIARDEDGNVQAFNDPRRIGSLEQF